MQRSQSSNIIESESGSLIFEAPSSQQRVIHDAPANVTGIFETAKKDALRLEAPVSGTELLHHIVVASAPKREQTVAAKQWSNETREWVSREFLRAISCDAEERHYSFWCAQSDGQPRLACRELRVESPMCGRQSDAGAHLHCTRVVHCQHLQLSWEPFDSEHETPVAQCAHWDASKKVWGEVEPMALAPLGVCAVEWANGVRVNSKCGDEQCVSMRAVCHASRTLSCSTPIHVARIELAAAHFEYAKHSVRGVREEQLVYRGSRTHSMEFASPSFVRASESFGGHSQL